MVQRIEGKDALLVMGNQFIESADLRDYPQKKTVIHPSNPRRQTRMVSRAQVPGIKECHTPELYYVLAGPI